MIGDGVAVTVERTLYSRYTDGSHPVHVLPLGKYEVDLGGGAIQIYSTKGQLLRGLTGHPRGRKWGFDRYFKLGKYARHPYDPSGVSVISLLADMPIGASYVPGGGPTLVANPIPTLVDPSEVLQRAQTSITTSQGAVLVVREEKDAPKLGIDLQRRGHEVAKLLFSQFGRKIFAAGYNPEDVLQEVYQGILIRNRGRCPWDERKSSFGHYVCIVCHGILCNYHRRMSRRREVEQVGVAAWDDGQHTLVDAALVAISEFAVTVAEGPGATRAEADLRSFIMRQASSQTTDGRLALDILHDVHQGWRRAELADKYGVTRPAVSRALTYLRRQAQAWAF